MAGVALGDRHGPNVLCCGVCVCQTILPFSYCHFRMFFPGFEDFKALNTTSLRHSNPFFTQCVCVCLLFVCFGCLFGCLFVCLCACVWGRVVCERVVCDKVRRSGGRGGGGGAGRMGVHNRKTRTQ